MVTVIPPRFVPRLASALLLSLAIGLGAANAAEPPLRCVRLSGEEVLLLPDACARQFAVVRPERDWRQGIALGDGNENRHVCWREAEPSLELLIDGLVHTVPATLAEPAIQCPGVRQQFTELQWESRLDACEDIELPPATRGPACAAALELAAGFAEDDRRLARTLEVAAMAAATPVAEEAMIRRALALRERHHGDDVQAMVVTLGSLAVVRQRAGDRDEAILFYRHALELGDRRLGPGNIEVTAWRLIYGKALTGWGLKAEAETVWRRCVEADRPATDPRRFNALHYAGYCADELARLYDASGRADDARRLRERAADLRQPLREIPGGTQRFTPEPDFDNDPG